jgi:hypothetical protein
LEGVKKKICTPEYGEETEGVEVYEGCVVRDTGEVIIKGGRNA